MKKFRGETRATGCVSILIVIFLSIFTTAARADEKSVRFANGAQLHFVFDGEEPGVYYSPIDSQDRGERRFLTKGVPTAIPHSGAELTRPKASFSSPFQERLAQKKGQPTGKPTINRPEVPPVNGHIQVGKSQVSLLNSSEDEPFMIANVDNVLWVYTEEGNAFQLPTHDELLYKGEHQGLVFEYAIVESEGESFLVIDFPFGSESSEFSRGEVLVVDKDGDLIRSTRMNMGTPSTSPTISGLRIEDGILYLPECVRGEIDLRRFKDETDWEGSITKTIRFRDGNREHEANPADWVGRYFQRYSLNMPGIRKSADPADFKEFDGMRSALLRRKIGNFVLLGPAGSGKTELLNAFVRKLLNGEFPEFPRTMKIIELTVGAVSTGGWLTGVIETRMEALTEIAKSGPVLLIIDEIHGLSGTGSYEGKASDIFESLKQGMANGEIHVAGTSTMIEFVRTFIGNQPLYQRFVQLQKKLLLEPEVLAAIRFALKSYHNLEATDEVVERIYENSNAYNAIGAQPRKATSLVDEIGARWKMAGRPRKPLTVDDVDTATLHLYGIDPAQFTPEKRLEKLNRAWTLLQERYVGQKETINKLFDYLAISVTSYFDPNKPRGLFLFAGDTGLGKTELAELLSESLGVPRVKITLSTLDYGEGRDALLRPIAEALRANSHSLIILDELEKVPTHLLDALLEVFDKGVFETSEQQSNASRAGTTRVPVDARNAIFIGTTNAGSVLSNSGQNGKFPIGIESHRNGAEDITHAQLKDAMASDGLSKPLLNRFFEIFLFKYYTEKEMRDILQVKFNQIFKMFADRKGEELLREALKDFDEQSLIAQLATAYKSTKDGAREAIFALRFQLAKFLAERQLNQEANELGFGCVEYLRNKNGGKE